MNSGNNDKNIDSAKELIDFKNLFDETSKSIMRDIVKEEFGSSIKNLINESKINEAEEDEDEKDVSSDTDIVLDNEESTEDFDLEDENLEGFEDEESEMDDEVDAFSDSDEDDESDFSEFEKYKVDDNTYDLRSDVTGEDAVKIFKLMKDDDQIITVNQEGDKINIKDYENDNEYIIAPNEGDDVEFSSFDVDSEFEINESRLMDILNEIDLGYTDSYQKKTAMSTDGVKEPAKGKRTWDKGAPTSGDETRRYGSKGKNDPYTEVVKEEFDFSDDSDVSEEVEGEVANVEEGGLTRTKRNLRQTASRKSKPQVKYTQGIRVDKVRQGAQLVDTVEESKKLKESKAKYEKLLKEYVEIKDLVVSLSETLKESMLHQTKLAKIVKLVTENTTTNKEKIEIINRFDKEVKSKEDADRLYESINKSLQKSNVKNINEAFSETKTVLNNNKTAGETVLYESKEINDIKSLMKRMDK